jgi:hypothetical protein
MIFSNPLGIDLIVNRLLSPLVMLDPSCHARHPAMPKIGNSNLGNGVLAASRPSTQFARTPRHGLPILP